MRISLLATCAMALASSLAACGSGTDSSGTSAGAGTATGGTASGGSGSSSGGSMGSDAGATTNDAGAGAFLPGNPKGHCSIPAAAQAEDVSNPTIVVGDGTPASCTSAAVVTAVHGGGVVTFNCGSDPVTIVVPEIFIMNNGGTTKDGSVTIDGGGKVTLSGGGANRILHQDTCDQSLVWTSPYCNNQDTPHLVVQNITLTNASGAAQESGGVLGGGAIYVGGGTFKAVNVIITDSAQVNAANVNVQDLAGGAIYTTNMFDKATANSMFTSPATPTYIVSSTFQNDTGINGGALGSIGTSYTILNSLFSGNSATGHGENPARSGTNGGGLGGAIYNDGNDYTLSVCGSDFENNAANELGSGSIFQVVDNLNGVLTIDQSTFTGNSDNGDVQKSANHPSIYVQAKSATDGTSGVTITNTTFN